MFAQHLKNVDVKGKKVILRFDGNVPLKTLPDGSIELRDTYRITRVAPTIEYIIMNGGIPILFTHFSDDEGKEKPSSPGSFQTTKVLLDDLETILGIRPIHCEECIGDPAKTFIENNAKPDQILLMENLRKDKGEKKDDPEFAKALASLGDIYCNDAFGVCHRKHASVHGIVNYFPKNCVTSGSLLRKEVNTLQYRLIDHPTYPMAVFIGGSKLSTKSKVIKKFLDRHDEKGNSPDVFLIGKLAREFARFYGMTLMGPMPNPEIIDIIKSVDIFNPKLHIARGRIYHENHRDTVKDNDSLEERFQMAYKAAISPEAKITPELVNNLAMGYQYFKTACENLDVYDIDDDSVESFSPYIKQAKTIMFNGPAGFFENGRNQSTVNLLRLIADNKRAYTIGGGGETNSVIAENNLTIKYLSTGGGAFLDFVAGETLPGLEALGYYD
ncbi:MAG: phosphoglycerate kinase [Candidatus Paceibacterota bacterium]